MRLRSHFGALQKVAQPLSNLAATLAKNTQSPLAQLVGIALTFLRKLDDEFRNHHREGVLTIR